MAMVCYNEQLGQKWVKISKRINPIIVQSGLNENGELYEKITS